MFVLGEVKKLKGTPVAVLETTEMVLLVGFVAGTEMVLLVGFAGKTEVVLLVGVEILLLVADNCGSYAQAASRF